MSGDISDVLPIPDGAGIIPRVLHKLFDKLGEEENEKSDNNVKCSFIELYNEELRDLLSKDDHSKLKIYDEANKNGRSTTMVQGMEESHIKSASKGIQLLREGSHKRQVAATKCNDLSSRSHTVFTVTVYTKRTSETGEDFLSAGKLNLVDLAGSENIQRSGAENKRAVEAGVINKSLLTLGRVINALVEKGSHIPYRESKLTRLLQDSLGGRTKTCIIATLSPAKSNLEETISTLDYAFRAKNIRNKPQVNQMVSKKTLLKEFTAEIEKLKSELIATRQRNGVYLTAETYEEITTESESRRILSEELRGSIEIKETNLQNKIQELFLLSTNFQSLKRDNEQTRMLLDGTKSVLDRTEIVLAHTKRNLSDEAHLREAHENTEARLAAVGEDLLGTLDTTTDHVDRLHSKLRRRSELQSANRTKWANSQVQVADATNAVEDRIVALRDQQNGLITALSERMQSFVSDEMDELRTSHALLDEKSAAFQQSQVEVNNQTSKAKDAMNLVLGEISTLREDVKQKVGTGLSDLSVAGQRISAGIASELDTFHGQLQASYVSLGREFKTIFEDMIKRMNEQQAEADRLRAQIAEANETFVSAGQTSHEQLQQAIEAERQTAASERASLLEKITGLVNDSATTQEARLSGYVENASKRIRISQSEYRVAQQTYGNGMDMWSATGQALVDSSIKSREAIKSKLKSDWTMASEQTTKLSETTNAVHGETVRIVDGQMAQMDSQLVALDEILNRVRTQNDEHHTAHTTSIKTLANNVQESYQSIGKHLQTSYERTKALDGDIRDRAAAVLETLPTLAADGDIRQALRLLREDVQAGQITEYSATGETPAKTQYSYPTILPRTEDHDLLLERLRDCSNTGGHSASPMKSSKKRTSPKKFRSSPTKGPGSPSKTSIFHDTLPTLDLQLPPYAPTSRPQTASSQPSLRELDANIGTAFGQQTSSTFDPVHSELEDKTTMPSLKRGNTTTAIGLSQEKDSKLPLKRSMRMTVPGLADGRENLPLVADLGASIGPRSGSGRRLRNRGSD
nr:kinesin-like protein bimc [Quercus suber]